MSKVASDSTWGMVLNFIWMLVCPFWYLIHAIADTGSLVEMWLGIICTCIPTLHTFIKNRWTAQSAKTNANNIRDNGMPQHPWIGLQDTPENPAARAKPSVHVDILDSKSHSSNSMASRSIVCEEVVLPHDSKINARSKADSTV